ncbi:MAG: hypothetical protein SFU99_01695 [Saprospiraceae bacterium]|nr:hypothetical protein [Saprospiraceae bacterium]
MDSNTHLFLPPEKIDIQEDLSQLIISYRWMKPIFYFLLILSLFFISCPFIFNTWIIDIAAMEYDDKIILIVFYILAIIVGTVIVYFTLCGFFNKTIILVNRQFILVKDKPLPLTRTRKISRDVITQLYVKQNIVTDQHGKTIFYCLNVVTSERKDIALTPGFDTPQEAQYIERKIERYLGIENQKVEGEYHNSPLP